MTPPHVYGLMAEYVDAQSVLDATRRAFAAGYRHMDAYTPYPVEGLPQAWACRAVRAAGRADGGDRGRLIGFFMQYWSMAVDYPFNSGGRPHNSWPAFIPITFEVLILVASLSALFSMLFLNGLPHPHHPVFSEPRFRRASQDRFFLCIEATDPRFGRSTRWSCCRRRLTTVTLSKLCLNQNRPARKRKPRIGNPPKSSFKVVSCRMAAFDFCCRSAAWPC